MLKFKSKWFANTHGPLIVGAAELPVRTVKYWDVKGEGEIVGQVGGRVIVCSIILHDGFATFDKFQKALDNMAKLQGQNGRLEESGTLSRTFENVTFHDFQPIPLGGQEEPGPIQDVGVLTRLNSSGVEVTDNGWFAAYVLRFRQLIT